MGIVGAILGEIVGSNFTENINRETCELFTDKDFFTDDSALKHQIRSPISFSLLVVHV